MKKLGLFLAAAAMAATVSAQTVTESKTFDNFYVGINGGVSTKTTGHAWLKNLNPNAGIRIGRNFTPVFSLAAESSAYFRNKPNTVSYGTFVRALNTSLLGTVNLTNWVAGYKGEPRAFEVIPVYGFGWLHTFNNVKGLETIDALTSKAGIDFQFNFGKNKEWAAYVEPSITWALNGAGYDGVAYNVSKSYTQLNAGLIYRFKNSNGTHNFTIAKLRDQAEIDALNDQINDLQSNLRNKENELSRALSDKDRQIRDLQNALDDCNKKPKKTATQTNLQPTVLFQQGKSTVDKAQLANVELIANYMNAHPDAKITIKGYASPEGSKEINDKLSNDRANNVRDILIKKYKIAADRITAYGEGATDKLFKQVEFNRVSTFNDDAMAEE